MKKISFFAGVSAIALAATSLFPVIGAYAQTAAQYDENGSTVTLTRLVNGVSNPVSNTFTYTITADADNPGTVANLPDPGTIVFNNVAPSSGTASMTKTIDFANADYPAVGDYAWTIVESASSDSVNYPVDGTSYTINISVRHIVNAQNVPTGQYIAYIKPVQPTWTGDAARTSVEIEADTTGNLADTSLCFEYTINVPGGEGDTYHLNYTKATGDDCENPGTITANTDTVIRLKHGDSIVLGDYNAKKELPVGVEYTITKNDTSDGYTTTFDGTETTEYEGTTYGTPSSVNIVNNKESDPVTGIVTSAWFYIILLAIGAFGLFFFIIARRRQDDEEQ